MIKIRLAGSCDQTEISSLVKELGYAGSNQYLSANLDAILQSNEHLLLVAESSEKKVIGWIHVFKAIRVETELFAEIGGFVVHSPLRKKGVGRSLLNEAENWVQEQGIGKLRVRTRSQRAGAKAFYQHSGFSCTKEQSIFDKVIN